MNYSRRSCILTLGGNTNDDVDNGDVDKSVTFREFLQQLIALPPPVSGPAATPLVTSSEPPKAKHSSSSLTVDIGGGDGGGQQWHLKLVDNYYCDKCKKTFTRPEDHQRRHHCPVAPQVLCTLCDIMVDAAGFEHHCYQPKPHEQRGIEVKKERELAGYSMVIMGEKGDTDYKKNALAYHRFIDQRAKDSSRLDDEVILLLLDAWAAKLTLSSSSAAAAAVSSGAEQKKKTKAKAERTPQGLLRLLAGRSHLFPINIDTPPCTCDRYCSATAKSLQVNIIKDGIIDISSKIKVISIDGSLPAIVHRVDTKVCVSNYCVSAHYIWVMFSLVYRVPFMIYRLEIYL
jgi:hypothetical protein